MNFNGVCVEIYCNFAEMESGHFLRDWLESPQPPC